MIDRSNLNSDCIIEIGDWYDIDQVKQTFSKATLGEGLSENDKLYFGELDLDERKLVVKYKIPQYDAEIFIERRFITISYGIYLW